MHARESLPPEDLGQLFSESPVGVAVFDLEFRLTASNAALARLMRVPDSAPDRRTWERLAPELARRAMPAMREALDTGRAVTIEATSEPAGETRPAHWLIAFFPIRHLGEVVALGAFARDVTEWRIAEQAEAQRSALVQATFAAALDSIVGMDAQGRVTDFNPAAERMFGYPAAEAIGEQLAALIIPPSLRDSHREGLARYLGGGTSTILGRRISVVAMRRGGEEFPVELTVARLPAPAPTQFIGYIRDLSALQDAGAERERLLAAERLARASAERQRERLEVLSRVGEVLGSSLDYEATLREVARVASPSKSDWCTVDLLEEDGALRRVAVTHVDPARAAAAQELLTLPAPHPGGNSAITQALGSGAPVLLDFRDEAAVDAAARGPRHRELLDALGLRSAIVAPLMAREQAIGVISFASDATFDEDDLRLAAEVGRRAGNAVENARLYADTRTLAEDLHATERRLDSILGSLAEAVTVRGKDGRTVYFNRAAAELLGLSQSEVSEVPRGSVADRFVMEDEHGRPLSMEELPGSRVLAGEQPPPLLVRNVVKATGQERWMLVKSTPLIGEGGSIEAAINVLEDVTAERRAELRTRFLAEASAILSRSLDYEQTLRNVAGLLVPRIADWCGVELLDGDGDRNQVAVAHVDPQKLQLAARLREYEPQELDPEQGMGAVLRTGRSQLYGDIPNDVLVQAAVDEQHLQLLREVGMRSVLIAPMNVGARTIGAITLVAAESGRSFDAGDVGFAEQLAERAAVAVDNARLYTERATVARTLQDSLLPDALPQIPGWEVAALYRPAGHGTDVGGDFYDLWPLQASWMLMVGDVTGKGVEAAALTSLVRHTARTASQFASAPAQVLTHVNDTMRGPRPTLSVCSALCLRLEGTRGTLSAGGHPLPLRVRDGTVSELGSYGPLLGAFRDRTWQDTSFDVRAGDLVVVYTDGVTDTVGQGGRFGLERLRALLGGCGGLAPADVVRRLEEALTSFQIGAQADDTAAVVMRYRGPEAA